MKKEVIAKRNAICTISSKSHLFKAKTLFKSLSDISSADFYCLLSDTSGEKIIENNITYNFIDDIEGDIANKIKRKYSGNKLRWALKPLLLLHLIENNYDNIIYVDNDICFYSSPDFLFEKLDNQDILLTPHYYPANPEENQFWLEANYKVGLFNAGFLGVNKNARSMLEWFSKCCLYNVKKSTFRGLFDDQKYLDLVPILFDNVEILKHKGCNVAGWNIELCPRSETNAQVFLAGEWPLVFVHYNYFTIRQILSGNDPVLMNSWVNYNDWLKEINPEYQVKNEIHFSKGDFTNYLNYFRYRLSRVFEK